MMASEKRSFDLGFNSQDNWGYSREVKKDKQP